MKNITFVPFQQSHFPLMLQWLERPHVKKWWDSDIIYTMDLIHEKYGTYVKGYKIIDGIQKPLQAFIIHMDEIPIGYIQLCTLLPDDFSRSASLSSLPKNLGALDILIGHPDYLGKGVGTNILLEFLRIYGYPYSHILVDPALDNISAIKCYEKAGFKKLSNHQNRKEVWMMKELLSKKPPLSFIDMKDSLFDDKMSKALSHVCESLTHSKMDFESCRIYLKKDNHIIGGVIYYIYGSILWCDSIYVEEPFQNQGYGCQLMVKLIEIGKVQGLREIQLNTYFSSAAIFFKKCGFEEVALIPNWKYDLTCYLMRKKI